ncbi:hypothetical protein [Natrinema versiforme]|uniref:hypothetical protein n=1 Tax=Natrinema versiforme TaxID=88724 RepID=UPI001E4747A3|nr:hypothetical protein [Natrinema versiforme]
MSQSSASESAEPADPAWRFGVYLFPLAPLAMLGSYAGLWLFTRSVDAESLGVGLAAFAVTVLAGWLSVIFAAIVAGSLLMDALALRDHPSWNPNPWIAGGLGLVHLAGAELVIPYLLSVPGIGYYLYRRRQLIGRDGGDDSGGSGGPTESTEGRAA